MPKNIVFQIGKKSDGSETSERAGQQWRQRGGSENVINLQYVIMRKLIEKIHAAPFLLCSAAQKKIMLELL